MGVKAGARAIPGHEINVDEQRVLSVDGLLPSTVMRPDDAEDAARGLRLCDLAPAPVVVWGGGTQMRLGAPPRHYEVAFSTERMTRLLEHQPADLTCRVEAGMRLSDLHATLRAQGQRLPLDPPHPERATVGGMVAANTNGLSRGRYGTVRDWVIGIAVAYPSGKVARAGGKVVKNVAGYDLMKLHIGALGTLGVVAEVNFKVQARPEAEATLLGQFEAPEQAIQVGLKLARHYLAPAAAIVVDRQTLRELNLSPSPSSGSFPRSRTGEGQGGGSWTLALKLDGYARDHPDGSGGRSAGCPGPCPARVGRGRRSGAGDVRRRNPLAAARGCGRRRTGGGGCRSGGPQAGPRHLGTASARLSDHARPQAGPRSERHPESGPFRGRDLVVG